MGVQEATAAGARPAHPPRSVGFWLAVLILALVLPAALAFSLLLFDFYRHEREARETQLFSTAKAMATAVDADLGKGWALLDALARSEELAARDWPALDAEARRMAPPGTAFVLISPTEGNLINTRLPAGIPLPKTLSPPVLARFEELKTRRRVASDLFVTQAYPTKMVSLDLLVRRDGEPAYALAWLMDASMQARLLSQQRLPNGWVAGLVDRQGVQISRSPLIPERVGQPATPDMRRRIQRGEEGVTETLNRDGRRMIVAFARAPQSQWTTVVAAPKSDFDGAAVRSLSLALGAAIGILLSGVLLAFALSQRMLRAVGALSAQAAAVGEGRPAAAVETGLAETDRVSLALGRAAAERQAHEEALAALNANLEARVSEATERLVQAQKMEALGQLTGGLAHDFNNLLTAVLGNLAMLRRTTLDDRQARLAVNAEAAGERGARLTQQLLAFSRRQRLTPEPVDLAALVDEARGLLGSTLGGAIEMRVSGGPGPLVMADRTQLELAILNLAINARDAMDGGGELSVAVAEQEVDALPAQEGAPPSGRYGAVVISDTGAGMTEEVRRRVFEPFFTTKGPGRGSGLGLPQALGMARQLGGGLLIDSVVGRGTTVSLLLPLAEGVELTPAARPAAAVHRGDLRGLRVLLVDDDEAVRTATAEMLALIGCEVRQAVDGAAALGLLADDVDLVIADFAMPGLNGAELAEKMAARRPELPVLLVTGYADPKRLGEAWRGAILTKPFDLEGLETAVRRAARPTAGS
jgi:signal transduction histidine kinase